MQFFLIFLAILNPIFLWSGSLVDPITKVSFPTEISFARGDQKYRLLITGEATRTAFLLKVYSIAHYMEDPPIGARFELMQDIFSDQKAKQFTLHWVHNSNAEEIQNALTESLYRVLPPREMFPVHNEVSEFISFFTHSTKLDDVYVIRWLPGGVIEVEFNGARQGSITNVDFAKAVWSIWLGTNSDVNRMQLLSLVLNK